MGKHSLPRARAPFWSIGIAGVVAAALITGTAATAPLTTATQEAPQAAQTDHNRDRQLAALLIEARIASGQRIEEDLTWVGMPAVVGQYNDEIVTRYGTVRGGTLCETDAQCDAWAREVWDEQTGPAGA